MTTYLRVSEAIVEGFTHYMCNDGEFGNVMDLTDLSPNEDFDDDKYILCEKEPFHPKAMTAKEIAQCLGERMQDDVFDDIGDDTGDIEDLISSIDFSEISKIIQEKLNTKTYWRGTEITLIPDNYIIEGF